MDKRLNYLLPVLFLLLLLLFVGLVLAEGNLSAIIWHTFGSGGGIISNADISPNATLGQPLIGQAMSGNKGITSGYWQVIPVAPIPVDDLSASIPADHLQLEWTAVTQDINDHDIGGVTYSIYRAQDLPYFDPTTAYALAVDATDFTDPDETVIGNSEHNTYYLITAVYQAQESAVSNRVGVFNFVLAPGTP